MTINRGIGGLSALAGAVAAGTFGGSVWLGLMSWAALGCCRLVPGLGSGRGSWG
jgi:hypothetical protein